MIEFVMDIFFGIYVRIYSNQKIFKSIHVDEIKALKQNVLLLQKYCHFF